MRLHQKLMLITEFLECANSQAAEFNKVTSILHWCVWCTELAVVKTKPFFLARAKINQ